MTVSTTRRAVVAAALAAGIGGLTFSSAESLLDRFSVPSGDVWASAGRTLPDSVESPHGPATLRVDDDGVPHVEADAEPAAYFAVGYVQAFQRLFQMDLQRRVMRGRLSEVAGEVTLESDEFNVAMDFAGAAEATWTERVSETEAAPLAEAYADGVNAAIENEPLPIEFRLLDYEPRAWTPTDSMLMAKQIAWNLTGSFRSLRAAVAADELGPEAAAALFPRRLDHDTPILRESVDRDAGDESAGPDQSRAVSADVARYFSQFESPPGVGSNSWVVSGDHTESGTPLLAYDPHLSLMAPPVWYEQHVETPERSVRGATFPGVPFVIAGANDTGVWSFTNVGADVLDCYRYEIDEAGERYRYRGEWREFETEEVTIPVADGEDRTQTVRKTVHGPVLEREGETVGVAWVGHTATRTTEAIYEYGKSEGLADLRESTRKFDLPTQNLVYADADGRTMYYATGQLPVRRTDGEEVRGDRVFDGSAGEGEWGEGFTPFGESSWDGFVPFEDKPHAIDPDVLATANQRVTDARDPYVGVDYAMPYRGARIYERLDRRVASDDPVTPAFHRDLQRDTRDGRAADFLPDLLAAVADADASERVTDATETLDSWDRRMVPDSRGALLFARFLDQFRRLVLDPAFEGTALDEAFYPNDWVLARLPEDGPFYGERSREETLVAAVEAALAEIEDEGWETYGDWSSTGVVTHPFGGQASFLNYPDLPAPGSRATVRNFRPGSAVGSSWRMVVEPGGPATAVLPGGNSGDYFSEHYDDQFRAWLANEQKPMTREMAGETRVSFGGGES